KNNLVSNVPTTAASGVGFSQPATSSNRWSADLAARTGVAVGRALIYGKAGIASSRFDFAENFAFNDGSFSSFANGSAVLTGLLFGAGLEYALASNWSAKLEFDRIDYLGRGVPFASGQINNGVAFSIPPSTHTETAATNVAKIGVNYRFFGDGSDPVVAKY
ncbi:MAG TPA: outer membrane beta-barrel protein, partial [Bradyrhizobium sp.]|nr:outer membrane beta-barrel protein [Bradyrhizobium sp.]